MFEEKIKELNQMLESKQESFVKRTYTVDEIQDILSISKPSAYNLVKQGIFRSVRIGGSIRISQRSLDEWLDQNL